MDLEGAAIVLLCVLGFLDALYFALVMAGRMPPDAPWVPRFCRMDGATCQRVTQTPYARLMGIPNAHYGLLFYAAVAGATLASMMKMVPAPFEQVLLLVLAVAATIAAVHSLFLFWALLVRLRTHCPLCYFAHGINVTLAALAWLRSP